MAETKDILLTETGNGGDLAIQNDDIALGELLYQAVYIAFFGGNVEAVTRGDELPTEIRQDWWGNSLQFRTDKPRQFNSYTERALNDNALNSTGRVNIQRAAEADLVDLKAIANVEVNVAITGTNKVIIGVQLTRPQNQQGISLQLIWDNAKKELIIERTV